MRTTVTKRKDSSLFYVIEFLERSHDAAVLRKEWGNCYLKNRRSAASVKDRTLTDALLSAAIELEKRAARNLHYAHDAGLLLLCFEGTKAEVAYA